VASRKSGWRRADPLGAAEEADLPVVLDHGRPMAMIIGMVPLALGLGEGGEQNAPLDAPSSVVISCDGRHAFLRSAL